MQISLKLVDWAVTATNLRAYANGAGSGEYTDFVSFDSNEMYKMFGVLFANDLTPKSITGFAPRTRSHCLVVTSSAPPSGGRTLQWTRLSKRLVAGSTSAATLQ
jgi:hypothetical protein